MSQDQQREWTPGKFQEPDRATPSEERNGDLLRGHQLGAGPARPWTDPRASPQAVDGPQDKHVANDRQYPVYFPRTTDLKMRESCIDMGEILVSMVRHGFSS